MKVHSPHGFNTCGPFAIVFATWGRIFTCGAGMDLELVVFFRLGFSQCNFRNTPAFSVRPVAAGKLRLWRMWSTHPTSIRQLSGLDPKLPGDVSSSAGMMEACRHMKKKFLQIKDYFTALYHAPRMLTQPALRQDLDISTEEIKMALHRIQPSKALSQNRRGNGEELAAIAAANLAVEVAAVVSQGQSAQSP